MINCKIIQRENDSIFFMRCLTFIGGFLNAYSYFTRGGAFVSFHTGNLVRVGLSVVFNDKPQLWNSLIPIIGGFIGAVIASLLRRKITVDDEFNKKIIIIEIITLTVIGFIWIDSMDNIVNFGLSMIAMFQLSSFRKIQGVVHNTTIMTGNLRTTSEFFSNVLIYKNKDYMIKFLSYLITFVSFPIGVIVGGFLSLVVNKSAIWFCVFILLSLFKLSKNGEKSSDVFLQK